MRGRTITIGVGLATPSRLRITPSAILPNGDFTYTSTPPTLGSGVTISSGRANCTAAGQIVTWTGVLTIGHRYLITLDYNASSALRLRVNNSATNGASIQDLETVTADSTNRSLTFYAFIATGTDLSIEADGATFTGWIDNVVATELSIPSPLTNSDFYQLASTAGPTLGAGATQPPGSVTWPGGTMLATWTGVLTVGQQYSIAVNYSCSSGSKLRISNSATDGTNVVDIQTLTIDSAPHTLTFATFTATSADLVLGADTATFGGTLTNVAATLIPSSGTTHDATGSLTGPGSTIAGTAVYNGAHPASGVLTGPGSTVAGTAAHIAIHGTSGALTGPGSTIVGSAARTREHATTGILTGPGSIVVGAAVYNAKHPTSGALTGPGTVVVGAAARTREHATTGLLTGPGSTVVGVAVYNAKHTTSGTLTGPAASLAGSATRFRAFAATGVLVGPGSTIAGSADHTTVAAIHDASGALTGPGSSVTGTAARFRAFAASGVLTGQGSAVVGVADHRTGHWASGALMGQLGSLAASATRFRAFAATGALVGSGSTLSGAAVLQTHHTSGVLIGQPSIIDGTARKTRQHATSGVITGPPALIIGVVTRWRDHDSSGALSGVMGAVFGRTFNGTPQLHDIPVDGDNLVNEPSPPSEEIGTITVLAGQIVNHPPYPAA